jgi:hypothetical protein
MPTTNRREKIHMPHAERCSAYEATEGRCQLADGHEMPHAMTVADGYLTWDASRPQLWSRVSPPGWLMQLAWSPGCLPAMSSHHEDLAPVREERQA